MIRFTCSAYPSLRVHRGNNTYIEFANGETYVDFDDAALLRAIDPVDEVGVARDNRGVPITSFPLSDDVVSWYSPVLGMGDGFGNSAERMILALEKAGQRVSLEPHIAVSGQTFLDHLRNQRFEHGAVRVSYCPPSINTPAKHKNQASLGFCMWEDTVVPPHWNPYLTSVDALAAPSNFCVDLFRTRLEELGHPEIPVLLVPLGVQTDFYAYRRRHTHPNQCFTFLHCSTSTWDERKGVKQVISAFREAFTNGENVKLIVRARLGQVDTGGDERIDVRIRMITEQEKLDLLYEAHALVYTSRGEGQGLIPLEAIATGLPTLCSANTGMLDYQDLMAIPVSCEPEPSRMVLPPSYESPGYWQVPRQIEVVLGMRDLFTRYREHVAFAARAAKKIPNWSYDRSAIALLEAINVARDKHRQRTA